MEANVWPSYSNPGPYYDLGWRYSVPYTIYTWGVAYRRDRVSDDEAAADRAGTSCGTRPTTARSACTTRYGDTIAIAILRNGSLDVNTGDADARSTPPRTRSCQTIDDNEARLTINGVYAKLPAGEFTVAESWSGDIVGAPVLPARSGTGTDVLGYWRPRTGKTMIGNDLMAIPTAAKNPRARARVHQLLARRQARVRQLRQLERLPAAVHVDRPVERSIDDGVVPDEPRLGGRDRGHVQERPHARRAAARRRPAVARRLDRDQGGCLSIASTDTPRRSTDDQAAPEAPPSVRRRTRSRASGTRSWYWPSFIAPGALWLVVLFVLPLYVVFVGRVRHRRLRSSARRCRTTRRGGGRSTRSTRRSSEFYVGRAHLPPADPHVRVRRSSPALICLVLGYAVAYYTARFATKYKGLILVLLVSPFWISYLMRIYAWQGLLDTNGSDQQAAAAPSGSATRTGSRASRSP